MFCAHFYKCFCKSVDPESPFAVTTNSVCGDCKILWVRYFVWFILLAAVRDRPSFRVRDCQPLGCNFRLMHLKLGGYCLFLLYSFSFS